MSDEPIATSALDPVLAKQLDAAAAKLDDADVPQAGRKFRATWEQARALGMTRERWDTGVIIAPGIREFE